jgi:Fe-S-cluster-containing hydrogenase component 2
LELREWAKLRQGPVESIKIAVNGTNCNGCGKCLVCVFGAITMRDNIAQIKPEQCMRCGLCSSICPHGAITLSEKM